MSVNFATFLYLVSGVLFILALRGLSHPTTSRQGNFYGMTGMAIAIVTTLALAEPSFKGLGLIVIGLAIGGSVGAYIAKRIAMTAMPQLVAAFHSLVGSCRGDGGRRGGLCAGVLRHRRGRQDSWPGAGRDVARRRHRRHHVYRLDHRLPEARRAHVGQADHAAGTPRPQCWPVDRHRRARRGAGPDRKPSSSSGSSSSCR